MIINQSFSMSNKYPQIDMILSINCAKLISDTTKIKQMLSIPDQYNLKFNRTNIFMYKLTSQ